MKNVIEGFSQEGLVAKNLDAIDAVILKYLVDFSPKHASAGGWYARGLSAIISDLPILRIDRAGLWERITKMVKAGLVEIRRDEANPRRCYIRLSDVVADLMYSPAELRSEAPQSLEKRFAQLYTAYMAKRGITNAHARFGARERARLKEDLLAFKGDLVERAMLAFFDDRAMAKKDKLAFIDKAGHGYTVFSSMLDSIVGVTSRLECQQCHVIAGHLDGCPELQKAQEKIIEPEELDDGAGFAFFTEKLRELVPGIDKS